MKNKTRSQQWRWMGACVLNLVISGGVFGYDPPARWGQATVVVNDALYVYGGKLDEFNEFGYTSAPNTNDVLYLSLSSPWPTDSPTWILVSSSSNSSTSQGPAFAWSSLSALDWNEALHFGGLPDPNAGGADLTAQDDSAVILEVHNRLEPQWRVEERTQIKDQPLRRFRHSTVTLPNGRVLIFGGEKADGSQTCLEDSFVFDPATLTFSPIPSENGPPGLCGHASIPLPDGRVLVFGGYSSSQDGLIDLSTIYVLDTTKTPYTWSRLEVATGSIPRSRRAFAATLIDPDKILIHGGADAYLQDTYSDGWILDLSQTPAVWVEIPELSDLGPRRDHFAVSQGSTVVIGFGWATSGPAPPGLQVFDTTNDTWLPSFSPSPPLITPTVPPPIRTTPTDTASGITNSGKPSGGSTTPAPNPTDSPKPGDDDEVPDGGMSDDKRKKVTAIAVSTTVGLLALVLVIAGAYYYQRHRHRRFWDERRFAPVAADENSPNDDDSQVHRNIPRVAGFDDDKGHGPLHGLAGIIRGATLKSKNLREIPPRRNMLDDEDAHDFGAWYDRGRRDGSQNSVWSLMSIFGRRSREPSLSTGPNTPWREKPDPFADSKVAIDEETGLVSGGAARPKNRREASYISTRSGLSYTSYTDPFQDPIQEEMRDVTDTAYGGDEGVRLVNPRNGPHFPSLQTGLPLEHVGHALSPLSERTSQSTLPIPDSSGSSSDHHDLSRFSTHGSRATSLTSTDRPMSPTLMSNILPVPSERPQRSGSWWTRLSRRRSDSSASAAYPSLIRDPNPLPRLVTIDEASSQSPGSKRSSPAGPTPQATPPDETGRPYTPKHGKSSSSLRTADSDMIERMAGTMEVVQRGNSHRTRRSTDSTGDTSILTEHTSSGDRGVGVGRQRSTASTDNDSATFASPTEMEPFESIVAAFPVVPPRTQGPTSAPPVSLYNKASTSGSGSPSSPISSRTPPVVAGGSVAARIQEFEKRKSQDSAASGGSGAKTEKEKDKDRHSPERASVDYGLVPRRSLFVANPDHRRSQSSLESS